MRQKVEQINLKGPADGTEKSGTTNSVSNTKNSIFPFLGVFFIRLRLPKWIIIILPIILGINLVQILLPGLYTKFNMAVNTIFVVYSDYVKLFFIIGIILNLIVAAYYLLSIYMFIMFSKNKMAIPVYMPTVIINRLKFFQELSTEKDKSLVIDFYMKLILIYIYRY